MDDENADPGARSHAASLRRLSTEIARFRSSGVQAALSSTPVTGHGALPPPAADADAASVHAALLAARAELRGEASARAAAEESCRAADARAAAAEDEVRALGARLRVEERQMRALEKAREEEVRRLEEQRLVLAKDSAEKGRLLRDLGGPRADAEEGGALRRRVAELEGLVSRLRREVAATRGEGEQEAGALKVRVAERDRRIVALDASLGSAKQARMQALRAMEAAVVQAEARESALRNDIVRLSAELAKRVEELANSRRGLADAERRALNAESSAPGVEPVEAAAPQTAGGSVAVERLKAEVAQLSKWIRAISPGGASVEEGIKVLREAVESAQQDQGPLGVRQVRLDNSRLGAEIKELKTELARIRRVEERVLAERTEAQNMRRQEELVGRVLEKKSSLFARIAGDLVNGLASLTEGDAGQSAAKAKECLAAGQAVGEEYRVASGKLRELLRHREEELRDVRVELAGYKNRPGVLQTQNEGVGNLRRELLAALKEVSELKSRGDFLSSRLKEAESKARSDVGELDYDPNVLKVVRHSCGPLASVPLGGTTGDDSRNLKRRRVADHDSEEVHGDQSADPQELVDLKKRNKELEQNCIVAERTKDVAKKKIEEIRLACCNLFGWDLRNSGATFRLSSIYAEQGNEELVFSSGRNSVMSLLEGDYVQRLGADHKDYLLRWKSIPGLLASITLENVGKMTMV